MDVITEEPFVLRQDEKGVAWLTLNRPAQFNPLSRAMLEALMIMLEQIEQDDQIRVVVLSAAGKAFCAGHDLKEMRRHYTLDYQRDLFRLCARFMMKLVSLPQPVIARVQGVATAAGCQLVSMCDMAVAAESARFAVSGINVGLFCATPGVGLSRNISRKAAFEMLVTGDFISAMDALRLGLVNHVVPETQLDEQLNVLVDKLLSKAPVALRMGKRLFYRQLEMGLDGAYQLAAETMACNMMCEETAEGVDAFIAKRPYDWRYR